MVLPGWLPLKAPRERISTESPLLGITPPWCVGWGAEQKPSPDGGTFLGQGNLSVGAGATPILIASITPLSLLTKPSLNPGHQWSRLCSGFQWSPTCPSLISGHPLSGHSTSWCFFPSHLFYLTDFNFVSFFSVLVFNSLFRTWFMRFIIKILDCFVHILSIHFQAWSQDIQQNIDNICCVY